MGSNSKTIVWFRRDLRIEDNPALAAAAREGSVLPVYIWCPKEEKQYYPGRVSRWWLKQSLIHLAKSLNSLGASLVLIKAQSTLSALLDCITAIGATKVVYNHLYDPVSLSRDHTIKKKLGELGISVQSYNGDLLYEPWDVYNEEGHAFTTFDAYWEKCLNMDKEPLSHTPPWRLIPASGEIENCQIENLGLEDESEKSSNALLGRGWSPGWSNADKALTSFLEYHLLDYSKDRLKVAGNSTSLLSPYLHFGELSVRKIFHSVRVKQILWAREENSIGKESVNLFLRALGFREYSRYICFNFPFTHEKPLMSNLKFFPWNADVALFKAWRQGRTGYPLVDAGMRELWATGWTHNRIRVIAASFFVKFLLLPWQWGMKYFWDTLLDADLECDILGWQYISGSLPDGHELERLDSPQVQGFNFDPQGDYVRQWLPELARMPVEWVHHPWDAPLSVLKAAGLELGLNYPKPIIDLDVAIDRLTEAIFIMRGREASSRAENSGTTTEVVFDNSDSINNTGIPRVILRENVGCPSSSSRDQRVPSMQNCKESFPNRKRLLNCVEEKTVVKGNLRDSEKMDDDDLCSTAVSSSAKKQNICTSSSSNSFSVPRFGCSSLNGEPYEQQQLQEESEVELNSRKQGT
ncbi:hypothetical protein LguiA_030665 [Lonicera macranthoides]